MGWHVAAQVSFCIIAQDVIFLDAAQDRYLQLGTGYSDDFLAWCRKATPPPAGLVDLLAKRGLLSPIDGPDCLEPAAAPYVTRELHSLSLSIFATVIDAPAVLGSFRRVRRALDRRALARVLAEFGCGGGGAGSADGLAARFCETARRLAQDENCLVRSLALRDYLERRCASAALVFGVTARPFKAHCWLQQGDLVLNDGLDAVAPFTPILVR